MTGRIRIQLEMPFGEIVVEGDDAKEILRILEGMPSQFMEKVEGLVTTKLKPPLQAQLQGIVEFTTDGPVISTRAKFTHYEAIGLVLYASNERTATGSKIDRLLQSSGVKSMVPARLNEMTKRSFVFKPDPARPEFKLTTQGEKWIEEEILPKLKKKT